MVPQYSTCKLCDKLIFENNYYYNETGPLHAGCRDLMESNDLYIYQLTQEDGHYYGDQTYSDY